MTEQIIQTLAVAPGPLTSEEIWDTLRRAGNKVEQFEVLQHLRGLQMDGFVRFEGVRWRLLMLPPGFRVATLSEPATRTSIIQSTLSKGPTANPEGIKVPVATPPPHAGRWTFFRQLCRYYMDCLVQDEAPQLKAFVENEDDTWIALQEVPWTRLAVGGNFGVPLAREQAAFQRNRIRRGAEECVYLGYPLVFVKPRDSAGFLVPLFAQPMEAEWSAGVLHLAPDGPVAVNGAWLDYRFRQRAEREAFLRAMGLLSDVDNNEEPEARVGLQSKDFARLAQNAAHYIHDADRFAEDIKPLALNYRMDWRKAKPGLYNAAVLMLGPRFRYTRGLLRDLRDIVEKLSDADLDQTALAALFPHDPPSGENREDHLDQSHCKSLEPEFLAASTGQQSDGLPGKPLSPAQLAFGIEDLAVTKLLHASQRVAVRNAMEERVSVVTGPPGTGKSEVVVAMLLNQLLRARPTLFASKNHQALEAVVPRLNGLVERGDLVVQTSSRELSQRQNYLTRLQSLLARPPRSDAARGEELRDRLRVAFGQQRRAFEQLQALVKAKEEYEELMRRFEKVRMALPLQLQGDEAMRRWPHETSPELMDQLMSALHEAWRTPRNGLERFWQCLSRRYIQARRRAAREALLNLPNPFADRCLPDDTAPLEAWTDILGVWRAWAEAARLDGAVRDCESRLARLPSRELCGRHVAETQRVIESTTREWITWAAGGLPNPLSPSDREALANLRAGIQSWGPNHFAKELRKQFPTILRAFPLWSVSNLSARSALPLVPALFDLVVIDEASQCDIASVVPLLARSRRAVFVGDPMQLRHVSTLDAVVEQSLLQEYGLTDATVQRFSYRVNSAYDLADANRDVPDSCRVRLDLHFRSHHVIADYWNEAFYSKTLQVVTLTEQLNIPPGRQPGIYWTHLTGKLKPGPTGAWCAEEIDMILQELLSLANVGYRGTVGVVTPFRQQMIHLKDALESSDTLPTVFKERVRLVVSTAHGFQGDERDLILFSLCSGPDLPTGAEVFLRENPNLFNVAVSRARAVLHIVGNRDWAASCGIPFIESLARRTMEDSKGKALQPNNPFQSQWEKVLADALREAGIDTVPQYPVAGRFLDLAILSPRKIDIEVDGESVHRTSGGGRKDDDHWRDLQLQSLGWQVCRFWVYELREGLATCVNKVLALVNG